MRNGSAITLYLSQEAINALDAEVQKRAEDDKSRGLTGYSITNRSRLASEIINDYLLSWEEESLSIVEIKKTISPILTSYGVIKADLFGSFARGEQTPESDIDLIIDRGPVTGLKFFALQNELSDALGRKVDLQPLDGANKTFLDQISKDRITLYAS